VAIQACYVKCPVLKWLGDCTQGAPTNRMSKRQKFFQEHVQACAELLQTILETKGPVKVMEVDRPHKEHYISIARRLPKPVEIVLGAAAKK